MRDCNQTEHGEFNQSIINNSGNDKFPLYVFECKQIKYPINIGNDINYSSCFE